MDFGWALKEMRLGMAVRRTGWNGNGMWLRLQTPDSGSKMTSPYDRFNRRFMERNIGPWAVLAAA